MFPSIYPDPNPELAFPPVSPGIEERAFEVDVVSSAPVYGDEVLGLEAEGDDGKGIDEGGVDGFVEEGPRWGAILHPLKAFSPNFEKSEAKPFAALPIGVEITFWNPVAM